MQLHYSPGPAETKRLGTEELRAAFLIGGLFRRGEMTAHYTDLDRMIVGAVCPPAGTPLALANDKATGAEFLWCRHGCVTVRVGDGRRQPGVCRYGCSADRDSRMTPFLEETFGLTTCKQQGARLSRRMRGIYTSAALLFVVARAPAPLQVRLEVWDVARNGAFTQPVWLE